MDEIFLKLYDIGAFKCGEFTLKSGLSSPIYIDLRETISYPSLLKAISEAVWEKVKELPFDRILGVPYTALPIASYLSTRYDIPMLMKRKEQKEHGTKKLIEGAYKPNDLCLIIEDLITSGLSIFETIGPLEEAKIQVKDVAVFLDRTQGGKERLHEKGYRLHSAATLPNLIETLVRFGRMDVATKGKILQFLKRSKT